MCPPIAILDGINGSEVLIIGMISLMLFGSKRLPEVARTIGKALREVRRATDGIQQNLRDSLREDPPAPKPRVPPGRGPARTIALPRPEPASTPQAPIAAEANEDAKEADSQSRIAENADALPYAELNDSSNAEPRFHLRKGDEDRSE